MIKSNAALKLVVLFLAIGAMAISNAQPTAALDNKLLVTTSIVHGIPATCGWSVNNPASAGHKGRITGLCGGIDALHHVIKISLGDDAEFSGSILFGTNLENASAQASSVFKYTVQFTAQGGYITRSDGASMGNAQVDVEGREYVISWDKTQMPDVTEGQVQYTVTAESEIAPDLGPTSSFQLDTACGPAAATCHAGFFCDRRNAKCALIKEIVPPWPDPFGTATQCTDGVWVLSPAGCGGWFHGGTGNAPGHGCAETAPCSAISAGSTPTRSDFAALL
jgi:hypothetical protein